MASAGSTAPPGGALQPAYNAAGARRVALDGKPYTWDELVKYYGNAAHECWDKASPADEEGESVSAGDARQLALHAADGGAPQPAAQFPRDARAETGAAASSDVFQLAVIATDLAASSSARNSSGALAAVQMQEPLATWAVAWRRFTLWIRRLDIEAARLMRVRLVSEEKVAAFKQRMRERSG